MKDKIYLTEVGLRDGLQSVAQTVETKDKLFMIDGLIKAGLKNIQVASFVHPKLVPQMADAEILIAQLPEIDEVEYSGLVLNQKGVERAINSGLNKIETSISTSETHSQKNTRMTLNEAKSNLRGLVATAKESGLTVRAGLQCVWGCVYEGFPDDNKIIPIVGEIIDMGADIISLSDSTGMANPVTIKDRLSKIMSEYPDITIALHLHDTRGLGLANLVTALDLGVRHFDSALGGIGGCPFIKGATGNIATEDTASMLENMGYSTQIEINGVAKMSRWLEKKIDKNYFSGKLYKLTA
tara:strand:+ start:1277 stop:2167 length:891 start_codon:yes stop_codon:yes gene_type:complete